MSILKINYFLKIYIVLICFKIKKYFKKYEDHPDPVCFVFQKCFKKNFNFFYFKLIFLIFLYCFDVLILKKLIFF